MPNTYLEIDSTYRNRNEWPIAGEFEIPISQSGRKLQINALDPVSLATPFFSWTSNNLDSGSGTGYQISGNIVDPTTVPSSIIANDNQTLGIVVEFTAGKFQRIKNYYSALVLVNDRSKVLTPILESLYLYTAGGKDIVTFNTLQGFIYSYGDAIYIRDSTDFSDITHPYLFVPTGPNFPNAFNNKLVYNETLNQYRKIAGYDSNLHIVAILADTPITGWLTTHNYSIRNENMELPDIDDIRPNIVVSVTDTTVTPNITYTTSTSTIVLQLNDEITSTNKENNYYKNCGLRIFPNASSQKYNYISNTLIKTPPINQNRVINTSLYINQGPFGYLVLTVTEPYTIVPLNANDYVEINFFSYDNANPFTYTGSLVSQQQMVCYEIELLNIVLPNDTLAVGLGGRIAFYPYVYVELSNVSAPGRGLRNVIYSNNPYATRATFRVPVTDVQNPLISTFIKLDGSGMVQTIKFKPNDNLYFSVTLPNGEIYQTVIRENYNPQIPNPASQISAMFSLRRL